jgi:hypothetical protein
MNSSCYSSSFSTCDWPIISRNSSMFYIKLNKDTEESSEKFTHLKRENKMNFDFYIFHVTFYFWNYFPDIWWLLCKTFEIMLFLLHNKILWLLKYVLKYCMSCYCEITFLIHNIHCTCYAKLFQIMLFLLYNMILWNQYYGEFALKYLSM